MRRHRAGERGSALAEFAIVSTAALTLIFGIIDFGRALYTYHLVSEAARLGSRYAVVRGSTACAGGTPDPLQSYVSSQAPGIDPSQMIVNTRCTNTTGCSSSATPWSGYGCLVTVNVQYPFRFIVALMPQFQFTMASSSAMVISQ